MRKNFGKKTIITPLPVLILATYDENGVPNAMNAAWGGQYDSNEIFVSLAKHKTTDNLLLKKAFTVSFAIFTQLRCFSRDEEAAGGECC